MRHVLLRRARILARVLLGVVLFAVTLAGIGLAGVTVTMNDSYPSAAPAALAGGWPQPARAPAGRTVVAVVIGSTGSVVTDVLAPYEVFARSQHFFVYTVSARRAPVALSGGLQVVPDHAVADVDSGAVPAPDVVVVPAVVQPTGPAEATLRTWITRQAGHGARILGVCAGSQFLATTGLLDHRRATSFWANLDGLRGSYPRTDWIAGQRYVEDGPITTTAGVTSGVVGALRLVERIAGTEEADRIGRDIAYPGWKLDGPTTIATRRLALSDLPYGLNAAFPWLRPTVGIGLVDGLDEIDVAAAFELYAGTSFAAHTLTLAAHPVVTTRHGVVLLADPTGTTTAKVDRFVVPGLRNLDQVDPGLRQWAGERHLGIDLPHAGRAAGEFSFDPVLRDLARHTDRATAVTTAKFTEYPAAQLRLAGGAWPWRSTLLAVLTLVIATGVALLPAAVTRLMSRLPGRGRRPAAEPVS
ncbi:DJ-1/PfpI family protein [Dactylosporangium sp. NPDC048998]|uniref:DJ-1/PfpI family protein n=1 Tax=Dactylosporangium sp. NPDC048998 TaxID=3363976 RepID=UPI003714172F